MEIGSYEAAQREKARALKRKFYPTTPKPTFKPPVQDVAPSFLGCMPEWKKREEYYDEHIMEWRRLVHDLEVSPVKAYLRRRAAQFGFTYEQITTPGGPRKLSSARFLIWWEIKKYVKPDASYPEIGRITGGFDHTSVLHGVRQVEKWKAKALEGSL